MQLNKDILSKTLAIIVPSAGLELAPLTRNRPQPLLPFAPEFRVIDFTISNCRNSGLRKAFLLAAHQGHAIETHLESADWSGTLITVRPDSCMPYRSSGDLLFQNIGLLQVEQPDYVLVLLTNHIYEMDYEKLMQFHVKRRGEVTIVTNGIVDVGVYVFNVPIFRRALLVATLATRNHDLGRTVIFRAANSPDIHTYDLTLFSGRHWGPVDTIDAYYRTQLCFSPLLDGCPGVVSPLAHISPFAAVTNSILMRGVQVGAYARIRKAIVEENLRIPDGTLIGFDGEEDRRRFIVSKGGVVVVDRSAIDRLRPNEEKVIFRLARAA